VVVELVKTAKT